MSETTRAAGADVRGASERRGLLPARWAIATLLASLLVLGLVRSLVVESFYVSSDSMAPGLQPGERILVSKLGGEPERGDLVVFDGNGSLAPREEPRAEGSLARVLAAVADTVGLDVNETDYVKRVIGVGGDRVICCDEQGRVTVNGESVTEPYLPAGEKASDIRFDVVVPEGRLWVMGDHRSVSRDSRSLLGAPGGGAVPVSRVVGEPVLRYWPLTRAGPLHSSAELADLPAARP